MRKSKKQKEREAGTPRGVALSLRTMYLRIGCLPTTVEQLDALRAEGRRPFPAFDVVWAVQGRASCTWAEAREAVAEVMPELYADYWLALWPASPPQKPRRYRPPWRWAKRRGLCVRERRRLRGRRWRHRRLRRA